MKLKNLIGDKAFYKMVLALAIPVMIQNGITNFVGLLDNIMVGQIGTEQMSGVAIANQLVFVFNLCIFGAMSGAGIYSAQFSGKGDMEGVRNVFRIKLWLAAIISLLAALVFTFFGEPLILLFLHEGSATGDLALTLEYGKQYLSLMRLLLFPFALVQTYASTLRETGKTKPPMRAGVVAVFVNLVFNYLLIFGNFGFPRLGIAGAAIATILSRIVEALVVIRWTHHYAEINPFAIGLYRTVRVPKKLIGQVAKNGAPLLVNESLWSFGMTMLTQCYSLRGLAVVAAVNIASTITQLFNIVFMSLGSSIGIIVGNLLGANRMAEARDTDNKMIAFSVASCFVVGLLMVVIAPLFPELYNTTEEVKRLAGNIILITAAIMPFHALTHACYFTLRSGGKTIVTFLFDSVLMWVLNVPVAFILSRYTTLPILPVYAICQSLELVKCVIGWKLIRTDIWMQNIVS